MRPLTGFVLGSVLAASGSMPGVALAASQASATAFAETSPPPLPVVTDSRSDTDAHEAVAGASAGSEAADAAAFADFGVLRASAFVTRGTGQARASASGNWEEAVGTSFAGFNGQHAEMAINVAVDGFIDPLGEALGEFNHELSVLGAKVGLGTGLVRDRITVVYKGSDQSAGLRPFVSGTFRAGELTFQQGSPVFISSLRTLRFSFTMGDELTFAGSIRASATELSSLGLAGSADVNFFNTSQWMGVSALRAVDPATGLLVDLDVAGLNLSAQSGRDYRFAITPVPLPGAAALLGMGLLTLLGRRKTARSS